MDFLFIDSRDPIFGLIVLVLSILVIVLFSYFWGVFSKKSESASIDKFLQKFENTDNSRILELLGTLESAELIKIANAISKMGDYQNAIKFYEKAIKNTADLGLKSALLSCLGLAYTKSGFLERAKDAYIALLGIKARDENALFHLIYIYEKLKDFKGANEAFSAYETLKGQNNELGAYLKALEILSKNENSTFKLNELKKLPQTQLIKRFELEIAKQNYEKIQKENLPSLEFCIDLLGENAAEFFAENFTDEQKTCEKNLFNLRILQACKNEKIPAKLEFSYVCKECQTHYPMFFARCPNCLKISSVCAQSSVIFDERFSHKKDEM